MKLPFSTEGLLLEGGFRGPAGRGLSGRPWTCSTQAQDPPHHLPSTGGQDRNQTSLRHELPKTVMLCGAGGPFRPVTGPFWGQTKGTSSQQQRVRSVPL